MMLLQYDSDNLPYEKVGKNEPVCIADEVPLISKYDNNAYPPNSFILGGCASTILFKFLTLHF